MTPLAKKKWHLYTYNISTNVTKGKLPNCRYKASPLQPTSYPRQYTVRKLKPDQINYNHFFTLNVGRGSQTIKIQKGVYKKINLCLNTKTIVYFNITSF